jgi:hypothetical protein
MNDSNHDGWDLLLGLWAFEWLKEYLEPSDPTLIQFFGMTVW